MFKHSSRSHPFKNSMNAFVTVSPGRMRAICAQLAAATLNLRHNANWDTRDRAVYCQTRNLLIAEYER